MKIAAKIDTVDRAHFEKVIGPLLDHPLVEFIGEISHHQNGEFPGNALALPFPIDWPEPFGVVVMMGCGTPVIAFPGGSVPEVIHDGETGLLGGHDRGCRAGGQSGRNVEPPGLP